MKKLLVVLGLSLVLVVGLALIFVDPLVAVAIRAGGVQATGSPAKLADADVSVFGGRLQLDGFELMNPDGFRNVPFARIERAQLDWRNRSLVVREIHVHELAIDGLTLELERSERGTNYGAVLERMRGSEPAQQSASGDTRSLRIDRIIVRDVRARLHVSIAGLAAGTSEVAIPQIVLLDYHSDGSSAEVIAKLLRSVVEQALSGLVKSGAHLVPSELASDLSKQLQELEDSLSGTRDALRDASKSLQDMFRSK